MCRSAGREAAAAMLRSSRTRRASDAPSSSADRRTRNVYPPSPVSSSRSPHAGGSSSLEINPNGAAIYSRSARRYRDSNQNFVCPCRASSSRRSSSMTLRYEARRLRSNSHVSSSRKSDVPPRRRSGSATRMIRSSRHLRASSSSRRLASKSGVSRESRRKSARDCLHSMAMVRACTARGKMLGNTDSVPDLGNGSR